MNDGFCLLDMKKNMFICFCKIFWIGDRCEIMFFVVNGYEFLGRVYFYEFMFEFLIKSVENKFEWGLFMLVCVDEVCFENDLV